MNYTLTVHNAKTAKNSLLVCQLNCLGLSVWTLATDVKPTSLGVTPKEMATELLKTLSSKKKEILMARSIPKAALYVRSLFPNLFFAIMAAGVRNTAAAEMPDD